MEFNFLVALQIFAATLTSALPSQHSAWAAKPAYFALAGDSTTATQNAGKTGGGWGNGFLNYTLTNGAKGTNFGSNGKTTASYRSGGYWSTVLTDVASKKSNYDVYVTIQFGHNDQKTDSGVTLAQYTSNLVTFANEVKSAGATPILVTPLTRRSFSSGKVSESLAEQRTQTIAAANTASSWYIDLNIASKNYCNALGETACQAYDLTGGDHTHLSVHGSVVFGRMVSDLLVAKYPALATYTQKNATLSALIAAGKPA